MFLTDIFMNPKTSCFLSCRPKQLKLEFYRGNQIVFGNFPKFSH